MKVPILHLSLLFFEALATFILELIVRPPAELIAGASILSLRLEAGSLLAVVNELAVLLFINPLELVVCGRRHRLGGGWLLRLYVGVRSSALAHRVSTGPLASIGVLLLLFIFLITAALLTR